MNLRLQEEPMKSTTEDLELKLMLIEFFQDIDFDLIFLFINFFDTLKKCFFI